MRDCDAVNEMIKAPLALRDAIKLAATTYLKTPNEEKSGIFHGKEGRNRAKNLQAITETDPVLLFSLLYAVMCPHSLSNFFESRSQHLAHCIAKTLIQGEYAHYTGACSTTATPNVYSLESQILEETLLKASTEQLDALDASYADIGSSIVLVKEKALRWMLTETRKKMDKDAKSSVDSQVTLFKQLLKKPVDETITPSIAIPPLPTPTIPLPARATLFSMLTNLREAHVDDEHPVGEPAPAIDNISSSASRESDTEMRGIDELVCALTF